MFIQQVRIQDIRYSPSNLRPPNGQADDRPCYGQADGQTRTLSYKRLNSRLSGIVVILIGKTITPTSTLTSQLLGMQIDPF